MRRVSLEAARLFGGATLRSGIDRPQQPNLSPPQSRACVKRRGKKGAKDRHFFLHSISGSTTLPTLRHTPSSSAPPPTMALTLVSSSKHFGGMLNKYSHQSSTTQCVMVFNIFLPKESVGNKVPVSRGGQYTCFPIHSTACVCARKAIERE